MANENDVEVKIGANASGLASEMKKGADSVKQGSKEMKDALSGVKDTWSDVLSNIKSGDLSGLVEIIGRIPTVAALAAGAIYELGKSMGALAENAKDVNDHAEDTSRLLGISGNQAEALSVRTRLAGVSNQEYISTLLQMQRQLRGNEEGFNNFGIKTRDANGNLRDANLIMEDALTKLKDTQGGIERLNAARDLFGRGTEDSIKLMQLLGVSTTEVDKLMKDYNLTITENGEKLSQEYKTAVATADLASQGLKKTIGESLLPVMTNFYTAFGVTAPQSISLTKKAFDGLAENLLNFQLGLVQLEERTKAALTSIYIYYKNLAEGIVDLAHGRLQDAKEDLKRIPQEWADEWKKAAGVIEAAEKKINQQIADLRKPPEVAGVTDEGKKKEPGGVNQAEREKALEESKKRAKEEFQIAISAMEGEVAAAGNNFDKIIAIKRRELEEARLVYGKDSVEYARISAQIVGLEAQKENQLDGIRARHVQAVQDVVLQSINASQKEAEAAYRSGAISAAQLTDLNLEYEAQRYKIKKDALEQLKQLKSFYDDPQVHQEVLDRILAIDAEYDRRKREIIAQGSQEEAKDKKKRDDDIVRTYRGVLTNMLTSTRGFVGSIKELWNTLVTNIVGKIIEIGIRWLLGESLQTAATNAGVTLRTAARVYEAAQSVALNAGAILKNIINYALEGAAAAYAAISAIPYVGPFLAPVVAGATLAAIIGFGSSVLSARDGFDVPSGVNPMVQLHEQEMVLPKAQADVVRSLADGGGGGGRGGDNFHIHVLDRSGLEKLLVNNHSAVAAAVKMHVRNGGR